MDYGDNSSPDCGKNVRFHIIYRAPKRKCRRLDGKTVTVLLS